MMRCRLPHPPARSKFEGRHPKPARRTDQQVDVAGIAGCTVEGERVGADDQVFNAPGVE